MSYKTFRRDRLRKLVEQDRIELIDSYSFDDMTGAFYAKRVMPVAIGDPDWRTRKSGVCYLYPHDFTAKSGACWQNDNGTVTLVVHSNSNYTLRIKEPS
jgi:hypothetical protein